MRGGEALDAGQFVARIQELYALGVRGLELDLVQDPAATEWSIGHSDLSYSSRPGDQFGAFLGALAAWSSGHEGHDLMVVHLEPKSGADPNFPRDFDDCILRAFDPSLLVRPAEVMKPADASLGAAISARGWPTLEAMRGRFLFCLSGEGSVTRLYASTSPRKRLCFADRGISQAPGDAAPLRDSIRPFLNIQKSGTRWKEILDEEVAAQPWILPRLWGARNASDFDALAARGAWMVAVNEPESADPDRPYRSRSSGTASGAFALAARRSTRRRPVKVRKSARARKPARPAKRRRG